MKAIGKRETIKRLKRNFIEWGVDECVKCEEMVKCVNVVFDIEESIDLETLMNINASIANAFEKEDMSNVFFYNRIEGYYWQIPTID